MADTECRELGQRDESRRQPQAISGTDGTAWVAPVDLICGGFPCQPVSHAGRRLGAADERWFWPEFLRIIREVRPRWALAENVPGLLSIDAGRLFGGMLRDLAENGYDAEWDCIPAAALGAPHIRDRVFVVAHAVSDEQKSPFAGIGLFGQGCRREFTDAGWWAVEPNVGRVAHRVPSRLDRLRGLGNAVVPQVAEYIGRLIMATESKDASTESP